MSNHYLICGILQIGIGVTDAYKSWASYRKFFGVDVPILDDKAIASLMTPYTGGEARKRHAVMAFNMQGGGGGFEVWQFVDNKPQAPQHQPKLGDFGVFAAKVKCYNIEQTLEFFREKGMKQLPDTISQLPNGDKVFYVKDELGNVFQLVEATQWFGKGNKPTGGIYGALLGVSNIEKSLKLYQEILGYDQIIYDKSGSFDDLNSLAGGNGTFRRVLLGHSTARKGAFSRVLGHTQLELFQALDREPVKIFKNRFWGDLGFIHVCFEVAHMDALKATCAEHGFPFTVDSANSFDMGDAAGRFSYIEDPDGTLIEFVETYRITIIKKLRFFFNLRKRDLSKPLPDWMFKAMNLNKKKD